MVQLPKVFTLEGSILIWLVFPFVFMSSDSSNLHKPHSPLPNKTTTKGGLEGGKRISMELVLDQKNKPQNFKTSSNSFRVTIPVKRLIVEISQ